MEPYLLRSAMHAALSRDPRIDAVLMPQEPDVRLQARHADVDALIVSHRVVRSDAVVIHVSAAGTVAVLSGPTISQLPYEGIESLADLALDARGRDAARLRHPARSAERAVAAT